MRGCAWPCRGPTLQTGALRLSKSNGLATPLDEASSGRAQRTGNHLPHESRKSSPGSSKHRCLPCQQVSRPSNPQVRHQAGLDLGLLAALYADVDLQGARCLRPVEGPPGGPLIANAPARGGC
jgi:hypothetical protein